jgi:hypothetical protein
VAKESRPAHLTIKVSDLENLDGLYEHVKYSMKHDLQHMDVNNIHFLLDIVSYVLKRERLMLNRVENNETN